MELNYKQYGEHGPDFLILHGLFGSLDNWTGLARQIADRGYRVWTPDLRNHGKSPHNPVHTYEAMADDLISFMEQHDLAKIHLLGHSMGGKVALAFSQAYPQLLRSCIVADIAPKAYPRGHDDIFDAIFHVPLPQLENRAQAEKILREKLNSNTLVFFLLKNLERKDDNTFAWKMNVSTLWEEYEKIRGEVKLSVTLPIPFLLIKGEHSDYVTTDDEQQMLAHFPTMRAVTIPDAGHWVHAENASAFLDAVLGFLSPMREING